MTKWKSNKIGCYCGCVIDIASPFAPAGCVCFDYRRAEWRVVRNESVTDCNQLPKLTAEVFDRPDCPKWAKYAAVDKKGYVFVFDHEPECTHSSWYKRTQFGSRYELCNGYDSSDYEHSLVRRSEQKQESVTDCNQLPDWCKVGEWAWDSGIQEYFRIAKIDEDFLFDERGGHVLYNYCSQSRLLPWTKEDAIGKVVKNDCYVGIITYADKFKCIVGTKVITLKELSEEYTEQDGTPCGKLERINEDGEWEE